MESSLQQRVMVSLGIVKATDVSLNTPYGIAVASNGTLFISDTGNNVIRKVGIDSIIITVVGNGIIGFNGYCVQPQMQNYTFQ
jgi:hypothetical protein